MTEEELKRLRLLLLVLAGLCSVAATAITLYTELKD